MFLSSSYKIIKDCIFNAFRIWFSSTVNSLLNYFPTKLVIKTTAWGRIEFQQQLRFMLVEVVIRTWGDLYYNNIILEYNYFGFRLLTLTSNKIMILTNVWKCRNGIVSNTDSINHISEWIRAVISLSKIRWSYHLTCYSSYTRLYFLYLLLILLL